jgi:hypothetical protein
VIRPNPDDGNKFQRNCTIAKIEKKMNMKPGSAKLRVRFLDEFIDKIKNITEVCHQVLIKVAGLCGDCGLSKFNWAFFTLPRMP